jgi:Flp pilus assembly protein TadG
MNRRKGSEAGQDLVEYALVLPLFLLLILGVVEFSLLFFQYNILTNVAREGARAGIMMETTACNASCIRGGMKDAARARAVGLDLAVLTVDEPKFFTDTGTGLAKASITVRYRTGFITRVLIEAVGGSGIITLEATATMQREF